MDRNWHEYLRGTFVIPSKDERLNQHYRALCNSTSWLNIHHRTYDRVGCEDMGDLITLCRSCHERHHLDRGGLSNQEPYRVRATA